MGNHTVLKPDLSWADQFDFAPAILAGNTIHTCGVVALDNEGNLVGEGDILTQSRQVFDNIRQILALGGATMDDVVKITTFLPELSLYKGFAQARSEAFPNGIPASTAVGSTLLHPQLLVEIEAVAVLSAKTG